MDDNVTGTRLAARLGITDVRAATALKPGLGGTELWRLHRDSDDLVLRAFAPGAAPALAEREAAAHEVARRHGIAAPDVLTCAVVEDRPVLAIEYVPGPLVADLLPTVADPYQLGRQCGAVLAGLHTISAVPAVIADQDWVGWAGDRTTELEPLLRRQRERCLLHLDFHPENLIMSGSGEIIVLDWANVRYGPGGADLARTGSILELIMTLRPDPSDREIVSRFGEGLLARYAEIRGEPGFPPELRAWAYAVQLHDLAGSWVPDSYFDRLRSRYPAAVRAAQRDDHRRYS